MLYHAIGRNGANQMMAWLLENWERVKNFYGEGFERIHRTIIDVYPETASTQVNCRVIDLTLFSENFGPFGH